VQKGGSVYETQYSGSDDGRDDGSNEVLVMAPSAFAAEGPKENPSGCAGIDTASAHNNHSEFIVTFPGALEPPLCLFEVIS